MSVLSEIDFHLLISRESAFDLASGPNETVFDFDRAFFDAASAPFENIVG